MKLLKQPLLNASYEIANNPKEYSRLVITTETIDDNKKYTLVRRKEN